MGTRTIVYGSLTVLVTAGYLVVVAGIGVIVGEADGRLAPLVGAVERARGSGRP